MHEVPSSVTFIIWSNRIGEYLKTFINEIRITRNMPKKKSSQKEQAKEQKKDSEENAEIEAKEAAIEEVRTLQPKTAAECIETKENESKNKKTIDANLLKDTVITECSNEARQLFEKSRYGTMLQDGRVELTLIEAYYLCEKQKIALASGKKSLSLKDLLEKFVKLEKNFWTRYAVYADFRNRGYIIKTALKFGADFRVYEKGIKPGDDHAKWIVYPVKETGILTWYEFAAKNRVAHSTKKRLLIGVVDEENSVTYYEIRWTKP